MQYEVFCTITMQRYKVNANSEIEAKEIILRQIGYPIHTLDICK